MSVGDGNVIRDMICRGNFVLIGAGQLGDMAISLWPEANWSLQGRKNLQSDRTQG
jgi:hypothetical protein